jgi:hypothetical protein
MYRALEEEEMMVEVELDGVDLHLALAEGGGGEATLDHGLVDSVDSQPGEASSEGERPESVTHCDVGIRTGRREKMTGWLGA